MTRRRLASAVFAIALVLLGCTPGGDPRSAKDWTIGWAERARAKTKFHTGTVFECETAEGAPQGVIVTHERWQLLRADGGEGEFERRRESGDPTLVRLAFHPVIPIVPYGGSAPRHFEAKYPVVGGLTRVRVPAGSFDCAHTWGSFVEEDGRVMRREQWWAPNIPVPVQTWVRWEGDDALAAPPSSPRDVAVGAAWTRLVAIRQP